MKTDQDSVVVQLSYKGEMVPATIMPMLPNELDPATVGYEVVLPDQRLIVQPGMDADDHHRWQLKSGTADAGLIKMVGEAIERSFL